jgi:1-acyl-sn-glycerol-3-phosphate acyltransferase
MINAFYWFITRAVQFILMPLYTQVRATGVEKIPLQGPLIVASNHLNDADPGVLSTRIPRRLVFMTKVELFKIPGLAQFLHLYGAFPVRRGEADLSALRKSNEALKNNLALVLFPEGTRASKSAKLQKAYPGAAMIALRNRVPIVPVAITGSQDMPMPWLFLRVGFRRRITLTVGEPFFLPEVPRVNAETVAAGTEVIMEKIAALLPPEYRGYYGEERSLASPGKED